MKTQILLNNFFQGEIKLIIDEVTVVIWKLQLLKAGLLSIKP